MTTLLLSHQICVRHEMPGSPESPARLDAIEQALQSEQFSSLQREDCPSARKDHIALAHGEDYIDEIHDLTPESGYLAIDGGTTLCPYSYEAAMKAAGGAVRAVNAVMSGEADNAFCAVRPPGHHATKHQAMGFCLFNNAAIAALHARKEHGAERLAVIDFDVHHGNGTQDIFWDEPDMFYGSTHQMPLYPGTGAVSETGAGNIVNTPLKSGADGAKIKEAFRDRLLPALFDFSPDFVVISAGFDAHIDDPLADLRLTTDDFRWLTLKLAEFADNHCDGRMVSLLEGGYDLRALGDCVATHVDVLLDAGL
ncbi:MAG: histone deacetylase family protein [bacterium]|nr:histone deacetylase family protein [bacterium]